MNGTHEDAVTSAIELPAKRPLAPGLYLVATPIGNLEDITLRALRVLRDADRIACEDTRTTARLLTHFGIRTPTVSYHLHNEQGRSAELIEQLKQGARVALVSDAGTPAIADPGSALVSAAIAAGVAVYPVPGAVAAIAALAASGLTTERFRFHGFLPSKAGQRRSALEAMRDASEASDGAITHIAYETPHRIVEALDDIAAVFGAAQAVVVARELTKLYEEFLRGTTAEVLAQLRAKDTVRGEMVLLLELGPGRASEAGGAKVLTLAQEMRELLASGASEKDAIKQAAKSRGLGKSEAYREWQRHKH